MEHRLVACLHADVSGYSRLITDDVEETARMLMSYQDMIGGLVVTHGGRVINVAGDSLLAAFPTVPAAVRCALEVQRQVLARNAGLPTHRRMQFRVGIEFGEVLVENGQLYGECVNVATRVQEIARARPDLPHRVRLRPCRAAPAALRLPGRAEGQEHRAAPPDLSGPERLRQCPKGRRADIAPLASARLEPVAPSGPPA